MDKEEILKKVKTIISTNLYVEETEIEEEDRFREDIGADSLDKVSIFIDFETEFSIEIPDEDLEKVLTIKEAVDYLANRI